MPKVGLKDVLALRAAGYSKKEIDALAAIDEENEKAEAEKKDPEVPAPVITESAPAQAPVPGASEQEPEPDYKAMYEDLMKKNQESLEKLKKLQEQNVHKNMAPDAAAQLEKQTDALLSMVRDFM